MHLQNAYFLILKTEKDVPAACVLFPVAAAQLPVMHRRSNQPSTLPSRRCHLRSRLPSFRYRHGGSSVWV